VGSASDGVVEDDDSSQEALGENEEEDGFRDASIDSNFDSVSSHSDGEDGREQAAAQGSATVQKGEGVSKSKRKRSKRRKNGNGGDLSVDKDGCLQKHNRFVIKNGCCRECMKAFSKQGKACLCQVPRGQRRTGLPPHGCKYCGCHGCNPIDIRKNKRQELREQLKRLHNNESNRQKLARIIDSDEEEFENNDKWQQTKQQLATHVEALVKTLASKVGAMAGGNKYLPVSPELLGFGIPSRHRTYILGCNRQWMSEDEYKAKRPKFSN